jgi:hypothetical protein
MKFINERFVHILQPYCIGVSSSSSIESYWISCFQRGPANLPDRPEIVSLTAEPASGDILGVLDHEIKFVTGLVRSLRERRNAISPISRLPLEVLVLIFKSYRDDDSRVRRRARNPQNLSHLTDGYSGCSCVYCDLTRAGLSGWIVCSRVCQRWRNIVLGTPSLWSDIVVQWGPLWLDRSLILSRPVPTIRFLGYLEYEEPDQTPDPSDLSRADMISLVSEWQSLPTSFVRGFRFTSPILKTIELTVTKFESATRWSGDREVPLPLGLLLHNFPTLERISLHGCVVNWEPPPLPSYSLRFMEIITVSITVEEGIVSAKLGNAKTAVDFFQNTPVLETLALRYGFPASSKYHEDTRTEKSIELPCLQELFLEEGHVKWCSYFFGRLEFPATSSVQLGFHYDFGGSKGKNLITSYLRQRFHDVDVANGYLALLYAKESRSSLYSEWKVHIHVASRKTLSLEVPTQSGPGTDRYIDLRFKRFYRGNFHHWDQDDNRTIISHEACNLLPPLFVRTLVIEDADAALWGRLADRFPSITSITCLSKSAIFHTTRDGVLFEELVMAFPNLEFLKLYQISLYDVKSDLVGRTVLRWLRRRKEIGLPIERLVLQDCQPSITWLDAARGIVECVETE